MQKQPCEVIKSFLSSSQDFFHSLMVQENFFCNSSQQAEQKQTHTRHLVQGVSDEKQMLNNTLHEVNIALMLKKRRLCGPFSLERGPLGSAAEGWRLTQLGNFVL